LFLSVCQTTWPYVFYPQNEGFMFSLNATEHLQFCSPRYVLYPEEGVITFPEMFYMVTRPYVVMSYAPKMEAERSTETSIYIYHTIQRYVSKDDNVRMNIGYFMVFPRGLQNLTLRSAEREADVLCCEHTSWA
jgi:hypothetical protein